MDNRTYVYADILKDAKELFDPDDYSKFVAALKDAEDRFAKGVVVEVPVNNDQEYYGVGKGLYDFMASKGGWFIEIVKAVPGRMSVHVTVQDIVATDTCVFVGKTAAATKKLNALSALRKHDLFYCSSCSNIYTPKFL